MTLAQLLDYLGVKYEPDTSTAKQILITDPISDPRPYWETDAAIPSTLMRRGVGNFSQVIAIHMGNEVVLDG